jgi:hypothetical protein
MLMNKALVATSLLIFAHTLPAYANEEFICNTNKHTAIVNQLPSGEYRYLAWNNPKDITSNPDIAVYKGEKLYEGTGSCAHVLWKFTNKNVEYLVGEIGCTESEPPKGANGRLSVFINGEHKQSWWCGVSH